MTQVSDLTHRELGQKLEVYCQKYLIPIQNFFEIINDQKVIPMLRGKGMEYNAVLELRKVLDPMAWEVSKLNLAAQPGTPDQDIGLTHRRTNIRFIVESKSAVRGSMTAGTRSRNHKVPHFKVKSHRSRSNTKLLTQGNDRYKTNDFDILITNPFNALIKGGTIGEELEYIDDIATLQALFNYYNVTNIEALLLSAASDWRFVLSADIAEEGLIPRTPTVYLENDPHWKPLSILHEVVVPIVTQRYNLARRKLPHSS